MGREVACNDSSPAVDVDLEKRLSSFGNVRRSCLLYFQNIIWQSCVSTAASCGKCRCILG